MDNDHYKGKTLKQCTQLDGWPTFAGFDCIYKEFGLSKMWNGLSHLKSAKFLLMHLVTSQKKKETYNDNCALTVTHSSHKYKETKQNHLLAHSKDHIWQTWLCKRKPTIVAQRSCVFLQHSHWIRLLNFFFQKQWTKHWPLFVELQK